VKTIQKIDTNKLPQSLINKYIDPIQIGIEKEYKNKHYKKATKCPHCKSKNITRHGNSFREKIFCLIIKDKKVKEIKVKIARFRCKKCGKNFQATNAPFYRNCIYGKPIVDICTQIATKLSSLNIQRMLLRYGRIYINKDTISRYCKKFNIKKRSHYKDFSDLEIIPVITKNLLNLNSLEEVEYKYYPPKPIESKTDRKKHATVKRNYFYMKENLDGRTWENYKIGRYNPVKLPIQLINALNEHGGTKSDILNLAINELLEDWKKGNDDIVKNNLKYNPPPKSDLIKKVNFAIKSEEQFEFINTVIKCSYARSMGDFIRRSLSWYLRNKKLLELYKIPKKNVENS